MRSLTPRFASKLVYLENMKKARGYMGIEPSYPFPYPLRQENLKF